MSDALKDALALLPSFVCASVFFLLSFCISGQLWFNIAAALAGFAGMLGFLVRHSTRRTAITAGGMLCLLAAILAPSAIDRLQPKPAAASAELVGQIAKAAMPLDTVDPAGPFTDLEPLRAIWRGTRLVALGEASHGTSEFFRMKHRLTRFLVTQMGFRHFAMELSPDDARRIEFYVQGGAARNPVGSLGWPWGTRELADLVDWMRQYNAGQAAANRVYVHGIDYQGDRRDFRMAANTLAVVEESGVDGRVILWAHNAHVSNGAGWMGSYLRQSLRDGVYLTGFEFERGSFTSNLNWVRTYDAEPADARFYAGTLAQTGRPILFLDFLHMDATPALESWLGQPHLAHHLQEAHGVLRLIPSWVRDDESWTSLYDGVIYIQESSPAHLIR